MIQLNCSPTWRHRNQIEKFNSNGYKSAEVKFLVVLKLRHSLYVTTHTYN